MFEILLTQTVHHYHLLIALAVHTMKICGVVLIVAFAVVFSMDTTSGHFE